MAAIRRRHMGSLVSRKFTLATADDLNGTTDGTQELDVSGAARVIIVQDNTGTAGTLGVDVVEISHDGGTNWEAATDVLAIDSDDTTGTVLANGALNSAGTEPTTAAVFKAGPYTGPTLLRIGRGSSGAAGTAWTTGAPAVYAFLVGGKHSGGTPAAQA